jgi:streptomycin 6-kinase
MSDLDKADRLTIQRVENGWVIMPNGVLGATMYTNQGVAFGPGTHVAATPEALATQVKVWATMQVGLERLNVSAGASKDGPFVAKEAAPD